jgi:hypothetical protein
MAATRREPASASTTLRVIDESTPAAEARYEELVSTSSVDRRLLHGPFASNVWGGRYQIDGFGGAGSQGTTFTGVDRKTGARDAVKLFDLGKAKDWKAQELFDREVQTLQRLSHPGVPKFLEVLTDDETGARALVMTFIAGESLGDILAREQSIPEKRLWALLVDAAHVMAHVHGEGVVHRDLKPDNLILKPDGTVAVVDFGGVGVVRAKAGSTVVGTFGFMAPEQLYGAQTAATDLYALGATVLTLATGKTPEDHPRDGLAVDVDAAAPFLSDALRGLLAKLLAPDPKDRPKDAAALLTELKNIAKGETSTKNTRQTSPSIYGDGSVDAIWHEDAEDAMKAAEGGLGVIAAIVGTLATIGLGRVLLPMILTLIAAFADKETARKIGLLKNVVEEKAKLLQTQMKESGIRSARQLEELNDKDRKRREKKQRRFGQRMERLERESERLERKIKREARKQEWWK